MAMKEKSIRKKKKFRFKFLTLFGFLTLVIVAGGLLFYFRWARASSVNLYPGSCLGSWQNPHLAQGRPDISDMGQVINKDNAAVFSEGGIKEIYCGSFNGDLSENEIKLIKSVNLKFSWLVVDEELQASSGQVATSSIMIIQPPATSSEAIASNTNYIINQILDNVHADEVQLIISTTTPEITIVTNASIPVVDSSAITTGQVSETIPSPEANSSIPGISTETDTTEDAAAIGNSVETTATSSPTSFWWRKFSFLFADDQISNTAVTISDVDMATLSTGSTSSPQASSGQAATSSLESPISPTEDFLKVSYTLDGVNWQELGMVNKNNWQDLSFNIPVSYLLETELPTNGNEVSTLEDIKKIQIKIESLPILNETPFVYLDGMALEVEYESGTLTQDMSSEPDQGVINLASSTPSTKPLKVRSLHKNVVLDEKATHSCRAEPFRLDISGKSYLATTLILQNSGKQEPEEIEIGSLPIGIDITFSKNKDYIYRPQTGETALDLEITSEPGSQKGSFGIPIIYTKKGVSDSTTVCQINVVNF